MPKTKFDKRPSFGEGRTSGPSKDHPNPRKKSGNPTKSGKVFGNWQPKKGK
jgi:hypothetical protein